MKYADAARGSWHLTAPKSIISQRRLFLKRAIRFAALPTSDLIDAFVGSGTSS